MLLDPDISAHSGNLWHQVSFLRLRSVVTLDQLWQLVQPKLVKEYSLKLTTTDSDIINSDFKSDY